MPGHQRPKETGVPEWSLQQRQVRRRLADLEHELEEHRAWLRDEPLLHRHEQAA